MSAEQPFNPGDRVVCINVGPIYGAVTEADRIRLVLGAHYTIVECQLGKDRYENLRWGVVLEELLNYWETEGYLSAASRFKKVPDTKEESPDPLGVELDKELANVV